MSDKPATVDFGAPEAFGTHVFRVEIPAKSTGEVVIIEDYGYRGGEAGIPKEEERVVLERRVWSKIADIARREFNARLKAAGLKTGRWHVGTNLVERLLGRELCVLAWAAEKATDEEIPIIGSRWAALRPEERWWLFMITVAEAGLPGDHDRGWRKALYVALSDGNAPPLARRRRRPKEEWRQLLLFKIDQDHHH
ncbi:MAG: anti-phage-associated DUF3780 domain-containing protein [Thermodesulforhabdaceae bacterium]